MTRYFADRRHLATLLLLAAILSFWQVRTSGTLHLAGVAASVIFVFVCQAYGRVACQNATRFFDMQTGPAAWMLIGFFIVNTLLFVLTLASPLGMPVHVWMLAGGALGLALLAGKRRAAVPFAASDLPECLIVLASAIAATLWCTDAQTRVVHPQQVVYQIWQDVFIHVREISVFAQAHGLSSIHDMKFAGAPAPIYHVASYMASAAFSAMGGLSAMEAYASFQLPFGIFLTGLAAYWLTGSLWGAWPGLAAALAILFLPDAFAQGFGNRYLGYHFLVQVNLGMLYGVACIAVAWTLMFHGCRRRQVMPVVLSYVFLLVCLFYKAHVFVANALLLLLYPCMFFADLKRRSRVLLGVVFLAAFATAIHLSQSVARIPVLRLDGSGIGQYIMGLMVDYDPGVIRAFFNRVLIEEHHPKLLEAVYAAAMLLLSTFGFWLFVTPAVLLAARRRIAPALLAFPVLIIANYLIMAMGLALDNRDVGTPDELLNRPLVWAYFAVAAWTTGAGYHLWLGNRLPDNRLARAGLIVLTAMLPLSTALSARNLQTFPGRPGFATYEQFNAVPLCLLQAATFIHANSKPADVMQDSRNDPRFIVTALAERQLYLADSTFGGHTAHHQQRLRELDALVHLTDFATLRATALKMGIAWYLLHPETPVAWPAATLQHAVFACNGYRVFHFQQ